MRLISYCGGFLKNKCFIIDKKKTSPRLLAIAIKESHVMLLSSWLDNFEGEVGVPTFTEEKGFPCAPGPKGFPPHQCKQALTPPCLVQEVPPNPVGNPAGTPRYTPRYTPPRYTPLYTPRARE
jgi:hypothetical protein